MKKQAPAKINLGLHVLSKRNDGFHALETVFLAIKWADELTFSPSDTLSLVCSDPRLPMDHTNLCMKAALILKERFQVVQGCQIHLQKNIPFGAGLGGGSSDAATVLKQLAKSWNLPVSTAELSELAALLGSDVPFFLHEQPMYATGRGEILTPLINLDETPYTFPFHLVVAMPVVAVPTPLAYRLITPNNRSRPDLRKIVCTNDPEYWRKTLVNDFQLPILSHFPEINRVATLFEETNAVYTSLSGSGAAFFGVFERAGHARSATKLFEDHHINVWTDAP
ncbi:MAG TPA: 4-(cytidine 5'-diphospho)-2-C-methyl-D-erythritol kinase [Bacteroidetes bacterium]|nr:4-(cytidine 5'-diphospho)-2-C-methyl-D-erythritol kinase [Bacteroidota bacterium]HRR08615.1 4-(cytidine 5'-diphospho)-2-C-methyl-D-erythritol kinase [Rhodothermales bacterium]